MKTELWKKRSAGGACDRVEDVFPRNQTVHIFILCWWADSHRTPVCQSKGPMRLFTLRYKQVGGRVVGRRGRNQTHRGIENYISFDSSLTTGKKEKQNIAIKGRLVKQISRVPIPSRV